MEVADLINQEKNECITKRGYEPKFAYLGKSEMKSLLSWAKDMFGHEVEYKADSGITFLDLRCLEVNIENHLKVA